MEMNDIKKHWTALAEEYGKNLEATTKTQTIKKLEINALVNAVEIIYTQNKRKLNILEIGCGNGFNCIALAKKFSEFDITGIDYVEEMIKGACINKKESKLENLNFYVGDILNLSKCTYLSHYDIIITNRCLINLNSIDLQYSAVSELCKYLTKNSYYLMLENSIVSYGNQNALREQCGLQKRNPDSYNLFLDDEKLLNYISNNTNLLLEKINNLASLHDIMKYIVLPQCDFKDHSIEETVMNTITDFLIDTQPLTYNAFGEYGQNRLYTFQCK